MKNLPFLLLAFVLLNVNANASDEPFFEDKGPSEFCETYEYGCERSTQAEEDEPTRENYPDNPDDASTPYDY